MIEILSPCTDQCELLHGACRGCGRTIDDIYEWADMTEKERRERMETLEE